MPQEEAAYVDPGFFYETVAPLTIVGNTTLLAISTLTSSINFYTRLMKMRDKSTGEKMFQTISIQLSCDKCIAEGKAADCVHLLHLIPVWQSGDRHRRLKTMMEDRPDLIQSELSGVAFDALHQAFRPADVERALHPWTLLPDLDEMLFVFIDPAAGGSNSNYCVLSFVRRRGVVTVRALALRHQPYDTRYSSSSACTSSYGSLHSCRAHGSITTL